jgi:predicted nucleic acid-binding Zn ribbon protein
MKECVNCGASLNDDEYYCENCGNFQSDDRLGSQTNGGMYDNIRPENNSGGKMIEVDMEADEPIDAFNAAASKYNTYGGNNSNDYAGTMDYNKKSNKSAKIVFGIAFVILLLIAGIVIKDRVIKDPRTAAEYYLDGICDMDTEQVIDAMAAGEDFGSKGENLIDSMFNTSESYFETYEMSYTINSVKELSDVQEDAFWKLSKLYSVYVPENKVKKVTMCNVKLTVKDKNTFLSDSMDIKIFVGKYKAKWKVIGVDTSGNNK